MRTIRSPIPHPRPVWHGYPDPGPRTRPADPAESASALAAATQSDRLLFDRSMTCRRNTSIGFRQIRKRVLGARLLPILKAVLRLMDQQVNIAHTWRLASALLRRRQREGTSHTCHERVSWASWLDCRCCPYMLACSGPSIQASASCPPAAGLMSNKKRHVLWTMTSNHGS
jgi:hypothetical protein